MVCTSSTFHVMNTVFCLFDQLPHMLGILIRTLGFSVTYRLVLIDTNVIGFKPLDSMFVMLSVMFVLHDTFSNTSDLII